MTTLAHGRTFSTSASRAPYGNHRTDSWTYAEPQVHNAHLEHVLKRHPILFTSAAMLMTSCLMVAAVAAFALVFMLPACLLAGLL